MLVHAGPKALDAQTLDFDSVDRVGFAAMAAAGFVGFIAVVVWVWLSSPSPKGQHFHKTAMSAQSAGVDVTPLRLARLQPLICSAPAVITRHRCHQRRGSTVQNG
jgi:hypothetical protein